MKSTMFGRFGLGWVVATWIVINAGPALADDAATPSKKSAQRTAADPIADPPAITSEKDASKETRSGPTLAPPRKGGTQDSSSRGDRAASASASKRDGKADVKDASTSVVAPDRPSGNAAGNGLEPRNLLQVVPDVPPPGAANEKKPVASPPKDGKALEPVPEDSNAGTTEIDTASFNGVTPGASTLEDVKKAWGIPKEMRKHQGATVHLYAVEPFDHVEVVFFEGKVTSVIIRLHGTFVAEAVAKQLALSKIRPVFVSNEMGEILGQSYPERGVLFSFTPSPSPGKATMKVSQIILEPVTAEPFVLRAETDLDSQPQSCLKDLEAAVKLAPQNGRARWLQARALVRLGDMNKALSAIEEAVRLEPKNGQYFLTHAQVLGQTGRPREAAEMAQKAIDLSPERPHVKIRAMCLLGDLASSGPQPDYKQGMQYHSQAIKAAEALINDPHPAIRQPAKEVLIDAHLGAAQEIAWGNWNNKEVAVSAWLKRASEVADDLVQNDGGAAELRFRVAARALAACVGLQGKLDPATWAEQAVRVGKELVSSAASPSQKQDCQRELGLALYDAVQVCQMRDDRDAAQKYGKLATEALEATKPSKDRPGDLYLLGRLYFRLGAIRASEKANHRGAVEWFDKALAPLQDAAANVSSSERGRLGETFVSMGVSYWEVGQRDKAVRITQQGVEMMEKAFQQGSLAKTALDVAYNNLATMHRQLGQDDQARRYTEKASAKSGTMQR